MEKINDPFKMKKLMEMNILEKESNYIRKIYDSMQFMKMIKETEGCDPTKFIITKKDQSILDHTKFNV